jgi:hypothetical protein
MTPMLLRVRLRTAAGRFTDHGWPVTPGSYFNGERMACDRPTCWASSCHPILPDWDRTTEVHIGDWWRERPHAVLLPTGRLFDVIEVPSLLGTKVDGMTGPVAVLPTARWMFLVQSGTPLRPELEHRFDIVRHGIGSWVPAPPTVLPEGQVRWHVSPHMVGWHLPESREIQQAMVSALVSLDATFLDLPISARRRSFVRPSSVEAALRKAG